jgi:hypothetical protein
MGLPTKAGGLLAFWEAIADVSVVAMVIMEPFCGMVTGDSRISPRSSI